MIDAQLQEIQRLLDRLATRADLAHYTCAAALIAVAAFIAIFALLAP